MVRDGHAQVRHVLLREDADLVGAEDVEHVVELGARHGVTSQEKRDDTFVS
jgi:hypothetical protein